jgi:hypothetical protein
MLTLRKECLDISVGVGGVCVLEGAGKETLLFDSLHAAGHGVQADGLPLERSILACQISAIFCRRAILGEEVRCHALGTLVGDCWAFAADVDKSNRLVSDRLDKVIDDGVSA